MDATSPPQEAADSAEIGSTLAHIILVVLTSTFQAYGFIIGICFLGYKCDGSAYPYTCPEAQALYGPCMLLMFATMLGELHLIALLPGNIRKSQSRWGVVVSLVARTLNVLLFLASVIYSSPLRIPGLDYIGPVIMLVGICACMAWAGLALLAAAEMLKGEKVADDGVADAHPAEV